MNEQALNALQAAQADPQQMEPTEITAINARIDDRLRLTRGPHDLGIVTYDVCIDQGLLAVRHDDESGTLFVDPKTARCCYAWRSGYVDDQI